MKMMVDSILIDTNIIIYSTLSNSPFLAASQAAITNYVDKDYSIWISRQIVREFLVVKSKLMIDEKKYDELILLKEMNYVLDNYIVADEIESTILILRDLLLKYKIAGKQKHDATIIATCIDNGISNILTNNPRHFDRFVSEGVNIIALTSFTTA